jgi:phage gp45-like
MKTKTIVLALALCFGAGAVCLAADPHIGTWKLNEAKSKIAPGAAKNHTVVYEAVGDKVKITVDGTAPDGKPIHSEWTGKYDGKDYPATGEPNSDARSYKKVDDRTLEFTAKKDGKVTVNGRVVVSADGKSRTVTTSGTNAEGKKFKSTAAYDKQ